LFNSDIQANGLIGAVQDWRPAVALAFRRTDTIAS
jgi:hypothetical protein